MSALPLALEGRNLNGENVEAVVQIFPEPAGFDGLGQVDGWWRR